MTAHRRSRHLLIGISRGLCILAVAAALAGMAFTVLMVRTFRRTLPDSWSGDELHPLTAWVLALPPPILIAGATILAALLVVIERRLPRLSIKILAYLTVLVLFFVWLRLLTLALLVPLALVQPSF